MEYKFYGWETATVKPINNTHPKIHSPRDLYDALSEIWCAETCAPRMRDRWTSDNKTLGQCSITAFLAQDIFGGKVYGILRDGGNYHCYNVIDDCVFDIHLLKNNSICGSHKHPYRLVSKVLYATV